MPRNTAVFEPTFRGGRVVRSDDIRQDPRYRRQRAALGMPHGHLPVPQLLAAPVVSRSAKFWAACCSATPMSAVFTARDELIVSGIAAQAAVGIDNARLYRASRQAEESFAD